MLSTIRSIFSIGFSSSHHTSTGQPETVICPSKHLRSVFSSHWYTQKWGFSSHLFLTISVIPLWHQRAVYITPYVSRTPLLTFSCLEKHTSRTLAWQRWLSLHMVVYITSSKHRLDATSRSRMQWLERERERKYMHNPSLGYLQCVRLRERDGACVCSYINPQWHARQQQKLSQRTAVAATASKPPGSVRIENTHTHTQTHACTHTLSIAPAL